MSCTVSSSAESSHSQAREIIEQCEEKFSFQSLNELLEEPDDPLNSGIDEVFFVFASIMSYTRSNVVRNCERNVLASTGAVMPVESVVL